MLSESREQQRRGKAQETSQAWRQVMRCRLHVGVANAPCAAAPRAIRRQARQGELLAGGQGRPSTPKRACAQHLVKPVQVACVQGAVNYAPGTQRHHSQVRPLLAALLTPREGTLNCVSAGQRSRQEWGACRHCRGNPQTFAPGDNQTQSGKHRACSSTPGANVPGHAKVAEGARREHCACKQGLGSTRAPTCSERTCANAKQP